MTTPGRRHCLGGAVCFAGAAARHHYLAGPLCASPVWWDNAPVGDAPLVRRLLIGAALLLSALFLLPLAAIFAHASGVAVFLANVAIRSLTRHYPTLVIALMTISICWCLALRWHGL